MLQLRRRDHTGFFFPKPAIPPARNEPVHHVADAPGNQPEQAQDRPGAAQGFQYLQNCLRRLVRPSVFYIDNRVQGMFRKAMFAEQPAAGYRLKGGKPKPVLRVAADEEADKAVAEVAHPIEKNNMSMAFGHTGPVNLSIKTRISLHGRRCPCVRLIEQV